MVLLRGVVNASECGSTNPAHLELERRFLQIKEVCAGNHPAGENVELGFRN